MSSGDSSGHNQVWFLPWIGWEDSAPPLTVGPVRFVAWNTAKPDDKIGKHLDRYFALFTDGDLKPVSGIALAEFENKPRFECLSEETAACVRQCIDVLMLASIGRQCCEALTSDHIVPTSGDRFQLLRLNFRPGDEHVAIETNVLHGGRWPRVMAVEPWGVHGGLDTTEVQTVASIVDGRIEEAEEKARLALALRWFRLAQTHSSSVDSGTKVIMLAASMEALYHLPMHGKAEELRRESEELFSAELVNSEKVGEFHKAFYQLRNQIVHGSTVPRHLNPALGDRPLIQASALIFLGILLRLGELGIDSREVVAWEAVLGEGAPGPSAGPACRLFFPGTRYHEVFSGLGWLNPT